jgi:hypothetical protein
MDAITDLLGGAERTSTRPRGFISWSPRRATLELLNQVQAVLREYADYLPLTIRQIFYRLVGTVGYDKTELAYDRLCEHLNRARRARIIRFSAIRDDGGTALEPSTWAGADDFLGAVRRQARRLELDRTEGQKSRLVVICEAAGMAPQLARVANPFGMAVISGGGFDSVTDKHNFARRLIDHDRPTEVLHIGDHDPSGVHMFLAFLEDVKAFTRELGGEARFTRLAVTPAQIHDLRLPTAPPKPGDRRAFNGETCQAEAIAPDDLANILRTAIESRIDLDAYEDVLAREEEVRRELLERLDGEDDTP